jgi:glycerophosphoryl diester phosphodiesterase
MYTNIIAHRGNAGEFTENTPEAIISALNWDVGGVEIDVHVSRDGIPFIHHDNNLKRIHNIDINITETHSSVLKKHVTPLADLVSYLEEYPHTATLFVELKALSMTTHDQEIIVPEIVELLKPIKDQIVIISFDYKSLEVVRTIDPSIKIGLVLIAYSDIFHKEAETLNADYIFVDYDKIPDNVFEVWEGNWKWVSYEIDSVDQCRRLWDIGIHIYETKQVQRMVNLLHPESAPHFAI